MGEIDAAKKIASELGGRVYKGIVYPYAGFADKDSAKKFVVWLRDNRYWFRFGSIEKIYFNWEPRNT